MVIRSFPLKTLPWQLEIKNKNIFFVKGKRRLHWKGVNFRWDDFAGQDALNVRLKEIKALGIKPAEERVRLINEISNQLRPEPLPAVNPEEFFDRERFVSKLLGDKILEQAKIKTLIGNEEKYYYENGLYLKDGRKKIKELCKELLHDKYTKNRFAETVSYIEACTYIDPAEIDNEWINLENGLLNPTTKEFIDHTPEVFSVIRVPITYDKKADCPLFKKALQEKLDKPTRDVVQEMFGYCYLPGQRFEKAFLLYGQKRTMKSTTLHILGKMLGKENVTAHSLQYLSNDPFGIGYLYGMPANICPDILSSALRETGRFMALVGGDKIAGQKKHQDPINFYPSTKLIFSCNDIPPTTNKNLAFYRRWILLEFSKQTLPNDVDENFKEKLEKELPGILNWALEGLVRLLKQHKFSYWLSDEEIKDLYEKGSDPTQSFIFHYIDTEDDEGTLKKREVYNAYKKYCLKENLKPDHQIKFGRMFLALTGCGTGYINKIPAYRGVNFKEGAKQGTLSDFELPIEPIEKTLLMSNSGQKLNIKKGISIGSIATKKGKKQKKKSEKSIVSVAEEPADKCLICRDPVEPGQMLCPEHKKAAKERAGA